MAIRRPLVAALAGLLLLAVPASGSPIRPHIVNGTAKSTAEYPYIVAVLDTSYANAYDGQFCGGSLIAPTIVMTAGHCVDDQSGGLRPASGINVVIGRTDLTTSDGDQIAVIGVYRYPGFSLNTMHGDVAMLELARPPAPGVGAVVALAAPGDDLLFAPGVSAEVVGWGSTIASGIGGYPAALRGATVQLDDPAACGNYAVWDPTVMLCAGDGTTGSCFGDSGGPLVVADGAGGIKQAGIVSYGGASCLDPTSLEVYAKVSALHGWIDDFFAPRSPDLVQLAARPGGVLRATWQPHNGTATPDGYLVTVEPGSETFQLDASATTADLPGLPIGVPLTVSISATIAGQPLLATTSDLHPTLPDAPMTTSFDLAVGPTGTLRVIAGVDSSGLPTTFHAEYGRTQDATVSTPTLTVQYYGSLYEVHVNLPDTKVISGDWWVRLVLTSAGGTRTMEWHHWYQAPVPPHATKAPRISGRHVIGARLRCLAGTWTSPTAVRYAITWRNGTRLIARAKGPHLTLGRGLKGRRIACVVTATNVDGSVSAVSAAVLIRAPH